MQELKKPCIAFLWEVDEHVCGSMGFGCTMLAGILKQNRTVVRHAGQLQE